MVTEVKVSVTALVISVSIILLIFLFWLFARNCVHVSSQLDNKLTMEYAVAAMAALLGDMMAKCATTMPDTTDGGAGSLTRESCPGVWDFLDGLERLRLGDDKQSYFFVIDTAGNQVMNGGNPAIAHKSRVSRPGSNTTSYVDPDGNKATELILSKAASGGGYVEYKWPLPGGSTSKVVKKMAYVKTVPNSKWIIGSGIYVQ
jgi:hypothetical protein